MKSLRYSLSLFLAVSLICCVLNAQSQAPSQTAMGMVPRLVNFSGRAADAQGKSISGIAGVTFAIYKDQFEGAPLWFETQNVRADAKGNYSVQLGASKSDGLPLELFSSGDARWLGVRVNGGEEQPRVLLPSVPYALKAADAQTLGGLPPSAFVLAAPAASLASTTTSAGQEAMPQPLTGTTPVTTVGGTVNKLAKFDANADVTNSQVFDNGTNVGIGNTAPAAKLDVSGTGIFRGALSLPATGTASATAGKNSQPFNFTASAFNTGTLKAVNETFRWQAEPVGNNTATPLGKLNLLFGSGTSTPSETGLSISNKGDITFASGQTFPSSVGTVKSVGLSAPSSDLTVSGSPVTTSGTLGLNWNTPPTSADTANAIVKRDANGSFTAGAIVASSPGGTGVSGTGSTGVYGASTDNDYTPGVYGVGKVGVEGDSLSGSGDGTIGVYGFSLGGVGVYGNSVGTFANSDGIYGKTDSGSASGVAGVNTGANGTGVYGTGDGAGVYGISGASGGSGVVAIDDGGGDGIYAEATGGGFAGFFFGDVDVDGNLSKAGGSFKIDHPLDPANKYLYHSFVESPDMMNIYNGNVTTDTEGNAIVQMPEWFEALNRDFRYQLTVIGQFAQVIVASEIVNRQFGIKTDKPNVKVSWQVTGVRQDAWANAHRIPVEQLKTGREHGLYLHPELFGAPREKSIAAARHAGLKPALQKPPGVPVSRLTNR